MITIEKLLSERDEVWKTIDGYEDYKISNTVKVLDLKKNKILKQSISRKGFNVVALRGTCCPECNHLTRKQFYVHRLMAEYFLPKSDDPKKDRVNHKNGVKTDNYPENLEWCTLSNIMETAKETLS